MEIKVLKGGLDPSNPTRYKFISGCVTNTRLMGVVAMHLAFADTLLPDAAEFHQFYYFDYEELGLEHMSLLRSSNPRIIETEEKMAFAGLGADIVPITEEEGCLLAYWMAEDTKKKEEELPEELSEVTFVLDKGKEVDISVWDSLNKKMCVPIKSDYGVINYFLMRSFGLDYEALPFVSTLSKEEVRIALPYTHCTYLRNKIESKDGVGTHRYYTCETLIDVEKENRHHVVVSEIEVKDRKVVSISRISDASVSDYEAGLILAKEEYVSVFDFSEDLIEEGEVYISLLTDMTVGMTHNEHPSGTMFMCFKENNNHAENKVFLLNDDLKYLVFVTVKGQIVISSFTVDGIIEGETNLIAHGLSKYLEGAGRYNFPSSIIYDFAESSLDDFNDFLGDLK